MKIGKVEGIPIAWVRENICKLVVGDVLTYDDSESGFNVVSGSAVSFNKEMDTDEDYLLVEFTERKSTESYPLVEDVIIVDYEGQRGEAGDWDWSMSFRWKPDFDAALAMYKDSLNTSSTLEVAIKQLRIAADQISAEFIRSATKDAHDMVAKRVDTQKVKFIKLEDELPKEGQIVWCQRRWTSGHLGSDGQQRSEWIVAVRRSSKPRSTNQDHSKDCYWIDAGPNPVCTFSDGTVYGWVALEEPNF
tara:strand:- start:516 stop:1256 length:741 start_codon:yes stop_codon:yes gene_type:complete